MRDLILAPENFTVFIFIFSLSFYLGIHILRSYKTGVLVSLNATLFFLCCLRAVLEYGIQNTDNFELAERLISINGPLPQIIFSLTWALLYVHIKPFKSFKSNKYFYLIDYFVIIILIIIPNIFICYWMYNFDLYFYHDHRIEGFWMSQNLDFRFKDLYLIYTYIVMSLTIVPAMMVYSIWRDKSNRVNKIVLLICFLLLPLIVSTGAFSFTHDGWHLNSNALIILIDITLISWFISDYQLHKDPLVEASQDFVNSLSDLIIKTNYSYDILHMNLKAHEYLDDTLHNLNELFNSVINANSTTILQQLTKNQHEPIELTMVTYRGKKSFNAIANPYLWRGHQVGYIFVLTDITLLKIKEQQLSKANRTKDQLFTILAHDLRNPALAFKGLTKKVNYLIKKSDYDGLNRLGTTIEQYSNNLNNLIDNLLKWALSQKDELNISSTTFNLYVLIVGVSEQFAILLETKNIIIDIHCSDKKLSLNNDPEIIATIIRNIIENAIKFSPQNGVITIIISRVDNNIKINIKDNGPGMSKEQLSKVSQLYAYKSTKGSSGESGSGLGLSLVYDLVSISNGAIAISSQINIGTEVSLSYANPMIDYP